MKTTRVEIECAVAAILSVTLPLYLIVTGRIFVLDAEPTPLTLKGAALLLIPISSYTSAPFLYRLIQSLRFRRVIPIWMFIALWGSLIFILIARLLVEGFFYFSGWEGMPVEFAYLTVYTGIVTGIVYYSGTIVRQFRKWWTGEHENLSILRK